VKQTICIQNDLTEIQNVQSQLTKLLDDCDCHPEKIDEICLITEEVLVNIVSHGFAPNVESQIKVVFIQAEDHYCLEFHDEGKTFNPLEAEERPEGKVGGWGIPLVVALSENVEHSSDSGTNVLTVQILKRDNRD
jgi:anti-sigma regulatory factor (Ser/Thr protein kinase)